MSRFLPILAILVSLSCQKPGTVVGSGPPPPLRSDGLIPLKVGFEWIYRTTIYDTAGAAYQIYFDTTRVYRDTVIEKVRWFDMEKILSTIRNLQTNQYDGVWRWSDGYTYRLFTTTLGDSVILSSNADQGITYTKLVALYTPVSTPAGNFNAYEYHYVVSRYGYTVNEYYIVPGIGLVKQEAYIWTTGHHVLTTDLVAAVLH